MSKPVGLRTVSSTRMCFSGRVYPELIGAEKANLMYVYLLSHLHHVYSTFFPLLHFFSGLIQNIEFEDKAN
jgi:hypothetical protein